MTFGGRTVRIRAMAAVMLLTAFALCALLLGGLPGRIMTSADAAPSSTSVSTSSGPGGFVGVASCAGTTCHGRMEADGKIVRQDELMRWQEPSTQDGAHSRAFAVLSGTRSKQIAATLGIGDPTAAGACLGCHATPASAERGPRFHTQDGVGCEACHGPASGWIASHYAVGVTHASNVAKGMIPLDRPAERAAVCLDCHFGSDQPGQFVTHRIMAAGHPRIAFELDLFSTLQAHHNEDPDYIQRKGRPDGVRMWAVGQALALERSLSLYASARGTEGVFPEFYFLDCHSCHRRIADQDARVKTWESNPGRPIPAGMPPYNDENLIMLSAAAQVAAPGLAARFDADSRAFHAAMGRDRPSSVAAARKLAASAAALAADFSSDRLGGDMGFAIIDRIASTSIASRFTDYEGSVQAVMGVDTLLNALVRSGRVTVGAAAGIRGDINRAYAAVREPNSYRPVDFRAALGSASRSIGALH
ncbi:MAG: multiheme c-type cytochrome [Sphingobium sp.]|uniref:multiheme c-type cytochrome n=1 Tax=Sphingobium sp. TaxID=1912891 RepID=UPI0029A10166|nr:multiheme c-type cytochrome [Sphingobium sp.]MDX3910479.1 multiheme c-type cytochrome [Sphingobium sp.]